MSKTIAMALILLIITISSCGLKEMKFDPNTWNAKNDIFYANREKMVHDLMKNHLEKGMTYDEVISLLGPHENYSDIPALTIGYEISVDYGWDIDPQKGKNLYIEFSKDSLLKEFRLEKWKH
jgi:hypothetical protein